MSSIASGRTVSSPCYLPTGVTLTVTVIQSPNSRASRGPISPKANCAKASHPSPPPTSKHTHACLWLGIAEPLAFGLTDSLYDPGRIVHLSGVPPELELAYVAMKVLLGDVVEVPMTPRLRRAKNASAVLV